MIANTAMQRELVLHFLFLHFQLLVNNKIISLDLPVAEVYKKVWCPTNEVSIIFIYVKQHKAPVIYIKIYVFTGVRIYFLMYNFFI